MRDLGGLTPVEGGQKYFTMVDDAGLIHDSAVLESKNKAVMLLNMGSTSIDSDFPSIVNNKNHRKLKKIN